MKASDAYKIQEIPFRWLANHPSITIEDQISQNNLMDARRQGIFVAPVFHGGCIRS
jgi:hypothetical protein